MADWERSAQEREAARLERERLRAAQVSEDDPQLSNGDGWFDEEVEEAEVPLGTRRVARSERIAPGNRGARFDGGTGEIRSPAPRRRAARTALRPRRRHSRLGRLISLLALALGAVLIWFLVELFQPLHGSGHGSVTVTIPPHSGAKQIGNLLEHDGVIASGFFFDLRALLAGDRSDLRSGTYHLKLDMSYTQALKVLTTAPPAAKVSELTIIEGRTRRQIDALLHAQGIRGSYLAATRRSPLLSPQAYGIPAGTSSLEGFLFPSTYQLRDPITISALVTDQLRTFRARFAAVNLGYARARHMSPYQVLIIASMVQAEAQASRDFPLISSVIYNRLADHMPLQIDATTRYATGNYTKPLTQSQLSSGSPYNTRVHPGLTPTPIDNPGLKAIQAAAHPASTNYLYFVVKPCGNGEHAFASSYTQFLQEVQQYYSARSQHGGKSPVHC